MSRDYSLKGSGEASEATAPDLPFRSPVPKNPLTIALVGAGGISDSHLATYRNAGFPVSTICNRTLARADEKAAAFFPDARTTDDFASVLADPEVGVLDITPHPADRIPLVEAALKAGKHVLSQKPFVNDLADGVRLCDLADAEARLLAVNQNGRWSPQFAYAREAIRAGVLGEIGTIDFVAQWDHTWTKDTPFEDIHHLILEDFAIHWFDIATDFMGNVLPESVYAVASHAPYQEVRPPFLASVIARYGSGAQVRIAFNAHAPHGPRDETILCGSKGTLRSHGPNVNEQTMVLHTEAGSAPVPLEGTWFTSGFQGTMAELLCAIEDGRTPHNNARDNLLSLRFAHAAIESADSGAVVRL